MGTLGHFTARDNYQNTFKYLESKLELSPYCHTNYNKQVIICGNYV